VVDGLAGTKRLLITATTHGLAKSLPQTETFVNLFENLRIKQ